MDKDVNMKATLVVTNTTWAVVKIRLEKNSEVMCSNPVQA